MLQIRVRTSYGVYSDVLLPYEVRDVNVVPPYGSTRTVDTGVNQRLQHFISTKSFYLAALGYLTSDV